MLTGEIQIRVRYAETDRMGLLHHANYLVYFEQGRTELLRQSGRTYKELEDAGVFLVIAKIEVRYRLPARYDDLLTLRTIVTRTTPVRIEHRYEVLRGTQLLAEGRLDIGMRGPRGQTPGSAGLAISIGRCLAATRSLRSGARQCNVLRSAKPPRRG